MIALINIILRKFRKAFKKKDESVKIENNDIAVDDYLNNRQITIIKGVCNCCNIETHLVGEEKKCIECIKKTSKNYTHKELQEIENKIKNRTEDKIENKIFNW